MALLCTCSRASYITRFGSDRRRRSSEPQFHSIDILKPNSRRPAHALINFGSKNTLRLQSRQRLFTIVALNSTTSGGHSPEKKKDETTSKAATQGPPLLTVLAGFVVFFLICWIFGSIIMWLISLIVIPPTSK
ncbi:uncharacterized protein LOC120000288 isoform X1 [Tripterygium wilfordii]|uniref:uncharacterized protein LOC120000288 isoform X1 n=1 Tax=Tripterygium wilfordii TaxID=458696 RepID=UPI0018F84B2D|nr:uncharacterized protein LOC120000288 isoform X1 [Tripterygium wilfordii]